MAAKKKPTPKTSKIAKSESTAPAPKADNEDKPKKEWATEVPTFLHEPGIDGYVPPTLNGDEIEVGDDYDPYEYEDEDSFVPGNYGTVILVKDPEKPEKAAKPVKLARKDFPKGKDGGLAYWDYKIAICEWHKAELARKADPTKRKQARVQKIQGQMTALIQEIAAESGQSVEAIAAQLGIPVPADLIDNNSDE